MDATSIIGLGTQLDGNVSFEGRLHINGAVRGNVTAGRDENAMLTLSESGSIEGNVHVPYVVLNGPVVGSVHATDHVELAPKARVEGDVHYALIEMAMGAEVNGKLVRITERPPQAPSLSEQSSDEDEE